MAKSEMVALPRNQIRPEKDQNLGIDSVEPECCSLAGPNVAHISNKSLYVEIAVGR